MQLSNRIGKFESPDSLLKGYEELEKEFTKRCQRLKELEKENERLAASLSDKDYIKNTAKQMMADKAFLDDIVAEEVLKDRVIEDYLCSLNLGVPVIGSNTGRAAYSPAVSAKTLLEAKALAEKLLNQ